MTRITCCKDCQNRHPHCHSDCVEYLNQKAELDKANQARRDFISEQNRVGYVLSKKKALNGHRDKWRNKET